MVQVYDLRVGVHGVLSLFGDLNFSGLEVRVWRGNRPQRYVQG